jgi:hypothetical protein
MVVLRQHIDTTTPTGRLVFHVLGAIDEFQRELIIEGTREGLDAARARGRTGGRKPKLNARQAATPRRMYQATGPDGKRQHTVAEIAEAVGVHRTTVYVYATSARSADMADSPQDKSPHAGQVVRRVLLRHNIAIDPETAQLIAAAVQAALQAGKPSRPPRRGPRVSAADCEPLF